MDMRTVLNTYRQFYSMPKETPDRTVLSHLVVLTVFFFTLGFAVSQFIIFVVGR
jgi:hypothetical protein